MNKEMKEKDKMIDFNIDKYLKLKTKNTLYDDFSLSMGAKYRSASAKAEFDFFKGLLKNVEQLLKKESKKPGKYNILMNLDKERWNINYFFQIALKSGYDNLVKEIIEKSDFLLQLLTKREGAPNKAEYDMCKEIFESSTKKVIKENKEVFLNLLDEEFNKIKKDYQAKKLKEKEFEIHI